MKKQEMPTQNNESPEISKLKWEQSVVFSQGENDLYHFSGYNSDIKKQYFQRAENYVAL